MAAVFYLGFLNFGNITQPNMPIPLVSIGRNWAGNVVDTNILNPQPTVNSVSASWTVPTVNTGTDGYSSAWIGIGGQFDNTLIQVGTEQDSTNGSATYYAWYELLPSTATPITTIKVSPGDQISASISMVNLNSTVWSISIEDQSTHASFQNNFNYNSPRLTAEWIVERPEINGALATLANFGSVTFTDCNANLSGKTGGVTSFTHNEVIMDPALINNHTVRLVTVSSPINGGTQFSVKYVAA